MAVDRAGSRQPRPDFLIRLATGKMLVLEVKGQDTQQNRTKRESLAEWGKALNGHGGFGQWACDVSFEPGEYKQVAVKIIAGRGIESLKIVEVS